MSDENEAGLNGFPMFSFSAPPTVRNNASFTGMFGNNYGWCGSFQQLLNSATSGALQFEEGYTGATTLSSALHFEQGDDAAVQEKDDGYLGGHEWVGGESSDLSPIDDNGWGIEFDTDKEDGAQESQSDKGQKEGDAVHLGDCGCVTAEGEDDEGDSDEPEDVESDSEESEDEEEITIEVDLKQEIFKDKQQEGVPYRKRKRANMNDKRPNCRKPRAMGAIERALRSASTKQPTEYLFEPILGMVFDSRQEAKEFYNMYSWEVGFGVKFNTNRPGSRRKKNDEEQYLSMQEIVCQKSAITRSTHCDQQYRT